MSDSRDDDLLRELVSAIKDLSAGQQAISAVLTALIETHPDRSAFDAALVRQEQKWRPTTNRMSDQLAHFEATLGKLVPGRPAAPDA